MDPSLESRFNLLASLVNEKFDDLEKRIHTALVDIEERQEQLRISIEDLREQQEHMCGTSTDLVKARKFVLDKMRLHAMSWVDVNGLIEIRGTPAARLLAKRIEERVKPIYKQGFRATPQQIIDMLNDSAFMANLRRDYIQSTAAIKPEVAAE